MSAAWLALWQSQGRMVRNALRPGSANRKQLLGGMFIVPGFMLSLFAGALYFLNYSGLAALLTEQPTLSFVRETVAQLSLEALAISSTTTFLIICLGALQQAFETFFLAPDLSLLLTSPASRRDIFLFKYAMNMRFDVVMVVVTALPIWLAFAVWLQGSPLFFVALLGGWALLLLLVSGVGIALAMVLVRFISAPRMTQIMLSFFLVTGLGFVIVIQGFVTGVWDRQGLMRLLGSRFLSRQVWLPSVWLSRGLMGLLNGDGGAATWPWFALLAGATVLAMALAYLAGMRLYSVGWSRVQQAASTPRRAHTRARWVPGAWWRKALGWGLMRKDLLLFARQPVQWYQAGVAAVVIVMILINFVGQKRDAVTALVLSVVMGYVGASTFAMNLSLQGVSREGRNWWILQTSPLAERDIFRSKFLTAFLPASLYATLALGGMQAALGLPLLVSLLSLPISVIMVAGMIGLDMAVGLWRADMQRATATRNADVVAVILSQLLNYIFLGPALFLLALPSLSGVGVYLSLPVMLLLITAAFIPFSGVVLWLTWRYCLRALRALRLSEPPPPLRTLWSRKR